MAGSSRRRPTRSLVSLLLFLLLLSGCIDLPTFLPEPSIALRIAVPESRQAIYLGEQIRAFERENPNIRVEVYSQMAGFRGNLASAIETLVSSSEGLDVVYLTNQDFQGLADSSILTDLTPFVRETTDLQPSEFYPMALPAFQSRGRQMAMPSEVVPLVVFYNRDLFDQVKAAYPTPGWTTTEFLAAAKAVSAKLPGRQDTVGFVADPLTTVWPFVLAGGGAFPDPWKDPSAKALVAPETTRSFQWFADLALREGVMSTQPFSRSQGLWSSGRAGMAALFMNARNTVASGQIGQPTTPTAGGQGWSFRWDVVPMPRDSQRATLVNVAGYGIPKGARNPNEAWQLIRYLVRTLPAQGAGSAYVPALKSLATSSDFAGLYVESGRQAYLDSVEFGQTLPVMPPGVQVGDQDLGPIFRGEVSAAQGLQRLREKLAPALEKWTQGQ